VRAELNRRRRTKDRIRSLQREYDFLAACDEYDQGSVDVLQTDNARLGKKDRGEMETIVQASVLGAIAIIDDRRGRSLAEQYGLQCHGTLWILEDLKRRDLLKPLTLHECFVQLRSHRIRFPRGPARELLGRFDEEPLDL
jgi:predicted nucleic acid-binding protein